MLEKAIKIILYIISLPITLVFLFAGLALRIVLFPLQLFCPISCFVNFAWWFIRAPLDFFYWLLQDEA